MPTHLPVVYSEGFEGCRGVPSTDALLRARQRWLAYPDAFDTVKDVEKIYLIIKTTSHTRTVAIYPDTFFTSF